MKNRKQGEVADGETPIAWERFDMMNDPAYAAAAAARAKLLARKKAVEDEINDYQAKVRVIPPVSPRQRRAEGLLLEAETGVAVAENDDRPDPEKHSENLEECASLESALVLAGQKIQHAAVISGRVFREELSPHRERLIEKFHVAVLAMKAAGDELLGFEWECHRHEIVIAHPWVALYLHQSMR